MHKITNVKVLHNYKLELEYDDGRQGMVDLSHLAGNGVFSLWNDYDVFRRPEDLFPSLKQRAAYA